MTFAVKRPIFGDPHTISAQEALIFDVEHHFQLSFGKLVNYVEIIFLQGHFSLGPNLNWPQWLSCITLPLASNLKGHEDDRMYMYFPGVDDCILATVS